MVPLVTSGQVEAGGFDGGAGVHHDVEPGRGGAGGGGLVDDAELQPHRPGADGDGLVHDGADPGGVRRARSGV